MCFALSRLDGEISISLRNCHAKNDFPVKHKFDFLSRKFARPGLSIPGCFSVDKKDDVFDLFLRNSFLEIVCADIQRIVIRADFQHFQVFDVLRKKFQERIVLDGFVGRTDDEDIGQRVKGAGLAMSQDDPGGFKKGPPVHMAQKVIDSFGRIVAVPMKSPMEMAAFPYLSRHVEGQCQMNKERVDGHFQESQLEQAGIDIRSDSDKSLASSISRHMARDQKPKRNAPEDKALKVQPFKSFLDISGIAFDGDLGKRRDILDETRKVDEIDVEKAAQIIDEPFQDQAIGQVGVDEDKVLFFAICV
jgi:hypothetical protein